MQSLLVKSLALVALFLSATAAVGCAADPPEALDSASAELGGYGPHGTTTLEVGSPRGCYSGYCIAARDGQCGVPDARKADAICRERGYGRQRGFDTMPGPRGAVQCSADGESCFVNQNPQCNIVFRTIDCEESRPVEIDVYEPGGCYGGYCSATRDGQCGIPDRAKARRICEREGYRDVVRYSTTDGPRGQRQCLAEGESCFVNQNPRCNIVFTTLTCR